ncbi:NAD(P)-dependent oxidoreductase [Metabacillus arenae]|uniref:NAD(P)-dependent oxidoreductase n=1 Tax=Metabacillus arenae TaxID=2771434 RepID=A0A926RYA8_9BACI|nr:NAD(P)-dependent oxidoreductase [Metabacillus arenae]MBD1381002.1 NAD(P)-dependent oxidoreductase [Metabacillus arenae]
MKNAVIGFLGLGSMGLPMCCSLSKNGYSLVLPAYRKEIDASTGFSPIAPDYEKKLAVLNDLLETGAKGASSLEELVEMSDIIIISMPTSKQVEELVLAPNGILNNSRKDTIVIDMTTADPNSTKKLSQMLGEKSIEMIDAPVSGGTIGAINQTLSIMAGGNEEIFEKCRPILEVIGGKIIHIGPIGSGHTIKLVNNFLSGVGTVAVAEAIMVTTKAGISPQKAIEVLRDSGGRNDATMNKFPNYVLPNKEFNFTLNLMTKDLGLYNQIAKGLKIPAFISNTVYQLWNIPVAKGEGDEDCLNIINMYEEWCNVKVRGTVSE